MHMHRDTKRFHCRELADLATRLEAEFQGAFRPYGARLALQPILWSHFMEIGEGFEIQICPDEPKTWGHWGDLESCVEVLRRRRWSQRWVFLRSLEDTEAWARSELKQYLTQLESKV